MMAIRFNYICVNLLLKCDKNKDATNTGLDCERDKAHNFIPS